MICDFMIFVSNAENAGFLKLSQFSLFSIYFLFLEENFSVCFALRFKITFLTFCGFMENGKCFG